MKTKKFARKPFYVDAVCVTENNMEEVAEWCGGKIVDATDEKPRHIKVKVHRPLTDRQTEAFESDWVLFAGTGYKVYTPRAFEKSFEKVKHLTKAQADEAGIKPPHEPSQKPQFSNQAKPAAPKGGAAQGMVVNIMTSEKKLDAADMLINEVLKNDVSRFSR